MTKIKETAYRTRMLRQLLRAEYGPWRYRLTRDGNVYVCARMPNTNVTGWYLLGSRGYAELLCGM